MFEGQVVDELGEKPVPDAKELKLSLCGFRLRLVLFVNSAICLVTHQLLGGDERGTGAR